jgi:membrane-associated phospholipid phosphatase
MATAMAHEYPSTRSKLLWYGVGATVAITRVTARQHFPSDVIAGSALGYLIADHIFHTHCAGC